MRGEYEECLKIAAAQVELPPRARRIPNEMAVTFTKDGTTSACAENTIGFMGAAYPTGNYLRVRGEYGDMLVSPQDFRELPPRARRIPLFVPRSD